MPEGLAAQIPQGDVQPADRVLDRSAAPEPEHRLPQFFADPLRLQARLADQVRSQQRQRTFDQCAGRVATADAADTGVAANFHRRSFPK